MKYLLIRELRKTIGSDIILKCEARIESQTFQCDCQEEFIVLDSETLFLRPSSLSTRFQRMRCLPSD